MKLGVHVGYWGLGLTAEDQIQIVQAAERFGFDSVWAAEAYGSDAATVLAWLAAQTKTIKLGSAIFQMPARTPAMTAMTAATLDQISGGRVPARHRLVRPAGRRGLARPAVRQASCSAPASTSPSCARRWLASAWSSPARRSSCRCPTARARRSS